MGAFFHFLTNIVLIFLMLDFISQITINVVIYWRFVFCSSKK